MQLYLRVHQVHPHTSARYVHLLSQMKMLVLYSVETTGINLVISKLMMFVENAETSQFLFLNAYFKLFHLFMTSSIFEL
jgi:hypothetical protein